MHSSYTTDLMLMLQTKLLPGGPGPSTIDPPVSVIYDTIRYDTIQYCTIRYDMNARPKADG